VSFVIHGAILLLWILAIEKRPAHISNPADRLTKLTVPVEILAPKSDDPARSQRVVQTEVGKQTDSAPEKAYLGERNQQVLRETVIKDSSSVVGGKKAQPKTAATPVSPQGAKAKAQLLSRLGVPLFQTELNEQGVLVSKTSKSADRPTWSSDGAGADVPKEYIKGVSESDRTALNTREYVFFSYFQRIRSRLDVAWSASLRESLERFYRKGRRIASDQEWKTRTWVTLNSGGTVVRVRLVEESGVMDLDAAALAAFNDAGPFPNPPQGLIDEHGLVELHWDFVLRN